LLSVFLLRLLLGRITLIQRSLSIAYCYPIIDLLVALLRASIIVFIAGSLDVHGTEAKGNDVVFY